MNSVRWRKLRNTYLGDHPLCERCLQEGRVVSARCVHHLTPIETAHSELGMEQLAFAESNLQALCFQCHADVHASEHSHTKEKHLEYVAHRLEVWKERHRPKK